MAHRARDGNQVALVTLGLKLALGLLVTCSIFLFILDWPSIVNALLAVRRACGAARQRWCSPFSAMANGRRQAMEQAEEERHEARVRAAMREFLSSPEAKQGVRIIPEEPSPAVQAANQVFRETAASKAEPAETDGQHYPKLSPAEQRAVTERFEKAHQAEREFKEAAARGNDAGASVKRLI